MADEEALLRAVAGRVGGRMDLMYDSSCYLRTLADAIRIGKVCDEYGFYWYEDPYADGGISAHGQQKLKQHVKTPLLIGEHVRNPETMTDLLVAGASDFARADPDYDGGITGSYKAAQAAQALGMDMEVHSCGPAMRQLMAALNNSNYYEVNLVHPATGNPWHLPVYDDDYSDELEAVRRRLGRGSSRPRGRAWGGAGPRKRPQRRVRLAGRSGGEARAAHRSAAQVARRVPTDRYRRPASRRARQVQWTRALHHGLHR